MRLRSRKNCLPEKPVLPLLGPSRPRTKCVLLLIVATQLPTPTRIRGKRRAVRSLARSSIYAQRVMTSAGGRAYAGRRMRVMTQKPTDWMEITTGFNGRAIHGSYAVEDGIVKVKTPRGERATQVEGVSNPIWLAVWLLRELAKEGKV